ncbi:hypothetical protein [Dictyobacter arantiisoli]|uniref:hypothetical protein n=1 Tax=Dictyobacter arantiisoli TaxID=2014874 RepID=UPI0011EF7F79|nr:hypothetical protein [Dictyobacter arantiisoli]
MKHTFVQDIIYPIPSCAAPVNTSKATDKNVTLFPGNGSLCLDRQKSILPHSYLFRDQPGQHSIALSSKSSSKNFRKAAKEDIIDILPFYRANTQGPGDWIEVFLKVGFISDQRIVKIRFAAN